MIATSPTIRHALLVALATLAAYCTSFDGVFLLDDYRTIVENPRIRTLSPAALTGTTRPLVQASLALNYAVSGLKPWSYHVVNLTLHLGAALALYGIARRTLVRFEKTRASASGLAATAAALWAVHPLQTESVTYIIQRAEVGMGLCVLLTLYAFARSLDSPCAGRWLGISVLCCFAGYGFKPIMAVTPVLVWLYDRCFAAGGIRARPRYYAALALTPLILPLLLAGNTVEWKDSAGFGTRDVTALGYAATQPGVILHYLRLALWPRPLVLDYGWPVEHSPLVIAATALPLLALIALTAWALRRRPACGFLGAWFFLNLAPTSSFVPISDLAFEHRMYLALAALVCGGVVTAHAAPARWRCALALGAVALYASFTIARNDDYASELRMWAGNVAARPDNPRPHNNLGRQLALMRQFDAACRQFDQALALRPDYAMAHYNYGQALLEMRQPVRAREHLERAAALDRERDARQFPAP